MLKEYTKYKSDLSCLVVHVYKIYHESDTYYKAKIGLSYQGMFAELRKTYKLMKKNVKNWKRLSGKVHKLGNVEVGKLESDCAEKLTYAEAEKRLGLGG